MLCYQIEIARSDHTIDSVIRQLADGLLQGLRQSRYGRTDDILPPGARSRMPGKNEMVFCDRHINHDTPPLKKHPKVLLLNFIFRFVRLRHFNLNAVFKFFIPLGVKEGAYFTSNLIDGRN